MLNIRIKELRMAHGLTQVDLAEKLSVSKQTVSNWENNNIQPSVDMLIKISNYFGVSTDYLLGRNNDYTLDVNGLTDDAVAHLRMLIKDLKRE